LGGRGDEQANRKQHVKRNNVMGEMVKGGYFPQRPWRGIEVAVCRRTEFF